ncbi:MAG: sugar phosphate isomerase/epimerase family protein [Trebonia sp.]
MDNIGSEPSRAHARVAVSGLCFPGLTAVESVGVLGEMGVTKTSLTSAKLRESGVDAVLRACGTHRVDVVTTTAIARFDLSSGADVSAQVQHAREDIDQAAAAGAASAYTITGPRAYPDWSANVTAYARLVADVRDYAAERGLRLAVEPTNWLYADLNFVHSFHDAVAFAARTGLGVCLDLFHVFGEASLREDIGKHVDLISHVQVSDLERGARSLPCRAVPGDGDLPLRDVVKWLLDAGYDGPFDLELSGPAIDAIGHRQAAERSVAWLDRLLTDLGA